jgi:hypothetical protein
VPRPVYGFSHDHRHASVNGRLMTALSLLVLTAGCEKPQGTAAMAETPSGRALRWTKREIVLTPSPEIRGGAPLRRRQPAGRDHGAEVPEARALPNHLRATNAITIHGSKVMFIQRQPSDCKSAPASSEAARPTT